MSSDIHNNWIYQADRTEFGISIPTTDGRGRNMWFDHTQASREMVAFWRHIYTTRSPQVSGEQRFKSVDGVPLTTRSVQRPDLSGLTYTPILLAALGAPKEYLASAMHWIESYANSNSDYIRFWVLTPSERDCLLALHEQVLGQLGQPTAPHYHKDLCRKAKLPGNWLKETLVIGGKK
jgi:hypothetical protein